MRAGPLRRARMRSAQSGAGAATRAHRERTRTLFCVGKLPIINCEPCELLPRKRQPVCHVVVTCYLLTLLLAALLAGKKVKIRSFFAVLLNLLMRLKV